MIAWINFAVLIFATLFFLYFYFLSVSPAALENVIGHGSRVNHAEKGWATVWSWLAVSFSSAIVGSGTILMEVTLCPAHSPILIPRANWLVFRKVSLARRTV